MSEIATSVLLIEDDPEHARLIQQALEGADGDYPYRVVVAVCLTDALRWLQHGGFDVVLLDLTLPDGQGVEAFLKVSGAASRSLILMLSDAHEEEGARLAVKQGAHDYFIKSHVDAHWLPRALHYVMQRKASQDALRDSEARFRAMSDASPLGIFVSDAEGSCVYTNAAYQTISGLTLEQALGTQWSMALHPEDRQRVFAGWNAAARGPVPFHSEVRFLRGNGDVVWARLNSAAMDEGTTLRGHVQTVEDITERKTMERVLRDAEETLFDERERAQVTLNSIGDAVLSTNLEGNVTYLNRKAELMTGWSYADAIGQALTTVFRIIDGTTRQASVNPAQQAIEENKTVALAADSVLIRQDGFECAIEDSSAPIHNRDGKIAGAVIVFHDVSESRAMTLKMSHLAQHDFLTGLPNRLLLTERLSQAIGLATRRRRQIGLLFLDLDYFKNINDSLGHAIGDLLLQSVAVRLAACVRSTDTVCRQGGDEFVILLADIDSAQDAANVAEKLLVALAAPQLISGHELHVTLSIGISIYPDDGLNVDTVMQNADTAMYHAKASGRNNYQFFRADMNTRAVQRQSMESSLRRALKLGEFFMHFQPKIDLRSGAMTGAEALIRWQDPNHGLIAPGQFVPTAEECGLIVPIGRWMLRETCTLVQAWLTSGLRAMPVSVNISAVEFRHKDFLAGVAQILRETGLPPSYLELELTESVLMHDVDASSAVLVALKAMGLKLAIDDFGTGYSSLSYLKRFPIDTLKIDQSFVRDIGCDGDDATIVSAVIGMGRNLKQRVVAEGVETEAQLAFLRTRQCDEGQGYLFSLPLSASDFVLLLEPITTLAAHGGAVN